MPITKPDSYMGVKAIQHFVGEDKEKHDLRTFDRWYDSNTIKRILHSRPPKAGEPLTLVFEADDDNSFQTQLRHALLFKNSLNRPLIFICKEPGAGQHHYIMGMAHQNQLLIINPTGVTHHQDFFTKLRTIQKEFGLEIFHSSTVLQRDPKGLVSCGPICTALAQYFQQYDLNGLFDLLPHKQLDNGGVHIDEFFNQGRMGGQLMTLAHVDNPHVYKTTIELIRRSHLDHLIKMASAFDNDADRNEYFEQDCENAPAQQLLLKVLENEALIKIVDSPAFRACQQYELSPEAKQVQQYLAPTPAHQTPASRPLPQPVNEPYQPDEIDRQLKYFRNLFLGSLVFILIAHFALFPLISPYIPVALASILAASSTPIILSGLALLAFVGVVVGVLAYEQGATQETMPTPVAAELTSQPSDRLGLVERPLYTPHRDHMLAARASTLGGPSLADELAEVGLAEDFSPRQR